MERSNRFEIMKKTESDSGAPIYHHEERERDFELAAGNSECIEKISDHIEKHIGPVATVYHELVSDLIHNDIHIVEPTPERNCYTLVTSGMSDLAMNAPEEYSDYRYAELLICLPPEWPMDDASWKKEDNYWPVRMLKFLARFPHEYQTWLWSMHTLPNGNPAEVFANNTKMSGVILLPPVTVSEDFHELVIDEDKTIYFLSTIPLHEDEMDLKLKEGAEALFDGFDKNDISEILIPSRNSIVEKKRSWFSFGRK